MKHCEKILKHHETHVKHCEMLEAPMTATIGAAIAVQHQRLLWQCRHTMGHSGNLGIGKTMWMCNRITNPCDIAIFSRPVAREAQPKTTHCLVKYHSDRNVRTYIHLLRRPYRW